MDEDHMDEDHTNIDVVLEIETCGTSLYSLSLFDILFSDERLFKK